jgi:hypothetical protein
MLPINEEIIPTEQTPAIDTIAGEELSRIEAYKKIYTETHPEVKMPEGISFWQLMGMEAIAFYLAALGGVTIAAVRTGGLFMTTEALVLEKVGTTNTLMITWLPMVAMISALLAFEGYLFAIGLRKGRGSGKLNTSRWGTGAAFVVSILAGIVSSLPIVDISSSAAISLALSWALALSMGIGGSILAYLGAENIGVLRNIYDAKMAEIELEYRTKKEAWYNKFQTDYRSRGRKNLFGIQDPKTKNEIITKAQFQNLSQAVENYLKEHNLRASDIGPRTQGHSVTPKNLCEEMGITENNDISNISVILSRLRQRENEKELLLS